MCAVPPAQRICILHQMQIHGLLKKKTQMQRMRRCYVQVQTETMVNEPELSLKYYKDDNYNRWSIMVSRSDASRLGW